MLRGIVTDEVQYKIPESLLEQVPPTRQHRQLFRPLVEGQLALSRGVWVRISGHALVAGRVGVKSHGSGNKIAAKGVRACVDNAVPRQDADQLRRLFCATAV